jgi:hypothetical protein
MSSTNRGSTQRHPNDFYETPPWLTRSILAELGTRLSHVRNRPLDILEPSSGQGAMVAVLKEGFKGARFTEYDVTGSPPVDFLKLDPEGHAKYDLIVTNPPFKDAMEFIQQAFRFRRDEKSVVAMILRLNFLGSRKRAKWLRAHPPAVYVTPRRPSFRPDGKTDSIEYAWFIWQEPCHQTSRLGILSTEDIDPKVGLTADQKAHLRDQLTRRRKAADANVGGV